MEGCRQIVYVTCATKHKLRQLIDSNKFVPESARLEGEFGEAIQFSPLRFSSPCSSRKAKIH